MTQNTHRATLGVISVDLAFGITWVLGVFVLGLAAGLFDWGVNVVAVLSSLYIGGALVAWLNNRFLVRRAPPPPAKEESTTTPSS